MTFNVTWIKHSIVTNLLKNIASKWGHTVNTLLKYSEIPGNSNITTENEYVLS